MSKPFFIWNPNSREEQILERCTKCKHYQGKLTFDNTYSAHYCEYLIETFPPNEPHPDNCQDYEEIKPNEPIGETRKRSLFSN